MLDQVALTFSLSIPGRLRKRGHGGCIWCRPRSPVTSPTWEEGNTAFDGEFDTLQNVFNDRQREMDDDEVESLRTPVPAKPQLGGGGGKTKKAAKKGSKKKGGKKKKKGKKKKSSGKTVVRQEVKLPPRPGERVERPRPMSAKRTMEMSEVESIAAAFARKGMDMPFSKETLEKYLLIPEDTPYEIAIRNLPLPVFRIDFRSLYKGKNGNIWSKKYKKKGGEEERWKEEEEEKEVTS